jgi:hypothetical protein
MPVIIFVDRSRIGLHRSYELRGRSLLIERKAGHRRISERIDLDAVVLPSLPAKIFNWAAINRCVTYLSCVLLGATIARSLAPAHTTFVAAVAAVLAIPGIHVILHYVRPMRVVQFRDANGKILFDVVRSNKNESSEFIATLQSALAPDKPNQSTDPTLASGTTAAGQQSRHP